jgi:hypothetical protein
MSQEQGGSSLLRNIAIASGVALTGVLAYGAYAMMTEEPKKVSFAPSFHSSSS